MVEELQAIAMKFKYLSYVTSAVKILFNVSLPIKITTVLEKTKQFKQTRNNFLLFVVILYFPCILLTIAAFWLISSITSLLITHFITHQEACASQPVCCLLDLILPYFHFAIICWKVDQSNYIPE